MREIHCEDTGSPTQGNGLQQGRSGFFDRHGKENKEDTSDENAQIFYENSSYVSFGAVSEEKKYRQQTDERKIWRFSL
jgi:hypothetical protein